MTSRGNLAHRRARNVPAVLLVMCAIAACTAPLNSSSPAATETIGSTTRAPLTEPKVFTSKEGALDVTLTTTEQDVEINGEMVRGRVYNGEFIAPTLQIRPGDTLTVHLNNKLPEPTNLHFHGLHVSPKGHSDNIFIAASTAQEITYTLDIPEDQSPGLYWYHSHLHGISEGQVFGGLSGLIIVDGLTDLLPEEMQGVTQHYLGLRDVQVADGAIPAANINSDAPTTRLVNGQENPTIQIAPGETQVWHLANIGADIWYEAQLPGTAFHVIAEDGSPVWKTWTADSLVMPPGKRFEVIVQGPPAGSHPLKTLYYDQGKAGDQYPETTLATVVSSGAEEEPLAVPTGLVPDDQLDQATFAQTRTFSFTEDDEANTFFINGKMFDPARVDATPMVNTVERWILKNESEEQHPFHIHVNDFQVLSVNGERYDDHGRQDTVVLPVGGTVVIANPFDQFTGKFVFHCHILAHEDLGMMAVVDVVDEKGRSHGQPTHDM